ncbi:MAG: hypothetical protein ACI80V_003339 [Rhodothermales bacterium]|jgi:hypothetical protein
MTTKILNLGEITDLLARTPEVLDALLGGTTGFWHNVAEGPETWSAFDVLGHLIHGEETDWIPRARIILSTGVAQSFEPFDRFAQFERFKGRTLNDLLGQFRTCRADNLEILKGWDLQAEHFAREGVHPAFGTVTLGQLLATWAVHDLNHLAQIARVMTGSVVDQVGPWQSYLSIVQARADFR